MTTDLKGIELADPSHTLFRFEWHKDIQQTIPGGCRRLLSCQVTKRTRPSSSHLDGNLIRRHSITEAHYHLSRGATGQRFNVLSTQTPRISIWRPLHVHVRAKVSDNLETSRNSESSLDLRLSLSSATDVSIMKAADIAVLLKLSRTCLNSHTSTATMTI